jgi:hypothetical protein
MVGLYNDLAKALLTGKIPGAKMLAGLSRLRSGVVA